MLGFHTGVLLDNVFWNIIVFELLAVNIIADFCELSGSPCLCLFVLFLHAFDGFVVLIGKPTIAELLEVVTE